MVWRSQWVVVGLFAVGCSAKDADSAAAVDDPALRYLGEAVVDDEQIDGSTTTWTFSTDQGRTACIQGAPYRASTRDVGSRDLVVFLQGGGACWDGFCLAVTEAPSGVPAIDLLDPALPENPLQGWNAAYLPYCDGSVFIGDRDHDDDGDGTPDRLHRGLANLTAALEMARDTLPEPERVMFAGSSGGGFGVLLTTPVVRAVFPDAELMVLSDSAQGVARGPSDPGFATGLVEEWGAEELVPADCDDCLEDGHMTGILDYALTQDEGLRVGLFSAWYDLIIGDVFLDLTPAEFRDALADTTGRLSARHPERFKRFLIEGRMHTSALGHAAGIVGGDLFMDGVDGDDLQALANIELGTLETTASQDGQLLSEWIAGLADNDARYVDVLDDPGPEPQ